jgi:DNA-binding NarL/FixJ family response regulator
MPRANDEKSRIQGTPARLLIVGRVRAHREALAETLARRPQIQVIAAVSPESVSEEVSAGRADLVLVLVGGEEDAWGLGEVVRAADGRPVVAVGVPPAESIAVTCVEAGIHGLITDECSLDDLALNIRRIALEDLSATMSVAQILLQQLLAARRGRDSRPSGLTRREREILELIAADLSNKEIAATLHLALPTVKNHVQSILRKLGVRRRSEAAGWLRAVVND